jgi:hypothetical protein
MTADQIYSLLRLWFLQVAWVLAAWLPLALCVILIALVIRWLHYRAKSIEENKVEPGFVGFLKITRDYISHLTIGKLMFSSIIFGLALGGMIAIGLQGFIQPEVQKVIEQKDFPKADVAQLAGQHISIDLILLVALILAILMIVIGVRVYRLLRRRASEVAGRLENLHSSRPLLVRLFYDSPKMGVLVLVIAGFLFFGMLMQIVGLMLVLIPLPQAIAELSFPFVISIFIWILAGLMIMLLLAFYGPSVWMGVRNFKLEARYYRENRIFRATVNVYTSICVCFLGALLNMWLIKYLGGFVWPSIFR